MTDADIKFATGQINRGTYSRVKPIDSIKDFAWTEAQDFYDLWHRTTDLDYYLPSWHDFKVQDLAPYLARMLFVELGQVHKAEDQETPYIRYIGSDIILKMAIDPSGQQMGGIFGAARSQERFKASILKAEPYMLHAAPADFTTVKDQYYDAIALPLARDHQTPDGLMTILRYIPRPSGEKKIL